jgi:hypothetical protein
VHNGEVAEIVRLEGQATQTEKASSADRWHAAQLISEQLEHKTFRQLSQDIKQHGGKGSIGHLQRMQKCWKLVGAIQYEAFKDDFAAYPNFTTIYQSDEVRGEGDQSQGSGRQRNVPEVTASSLVTAAADAISELAHNREYRRQLTEGDMSSLRETRDTIRSLIRDFDR